MILAVLRPNDPPVLLAKRAAAIAGDLYLDTRPITDADAEALLYEWGSRAALMNASDYEHERRAAKEVARACVQLELALRAARRWTRAGGPNEQAFEGERA